MPILTEADHDSFIYNGIVVLRGLVPRELCDAAAAKLDEVGRAGEVQGDIGALPEIQACMTDACSQVFDEIFGDELKSKDYNAPFSIVRQPEKSLNPDIRAPDVQGFHMDDDYPTILPCGWCIRLVVFPRKVIHGGGAFIYSPGSHMRYMAHMVQSPDDAKRVAGLPDYSAPYIEFTCDAGDAVVMSAQLGHTGSNNWTNPLPRHFLARVGHHSRNLVTAGRPLDELSTIEKAHSPRYFQERLGIPMRLPEIGEPDAVNRLLAGGWSPPEGIRSYTIQRRDGLTHILVAAQDMRKQIRRYLASDWSGAVERSPIKMSHRPDHVNLHQVFADTTLCVTTRGKHPLLSLYVTDSGLWDWDKVGSLRARAGYTFRWSGFGSGSAIGRVVLYTDGLTIRRRVTPENGTALTVWQAAVDSGDDEEVWSGCGKRLSDLMVQAIFGEGEYAFIVDVEDVDGPTAHTMRSSGDGCKYGDTIAAPLPIAGEGDAPFHVRVYMRGRRFWLITYLQDSGDGARLFWGAIDWEAEERQIQPIKNVQDLEAAFGQVGLR